MSDLPRVQDTISPETASSWTKSSLSHANGNCVEITSLPEGQVGMRDSKNAAGPVLQFPAEEWRAFLSGVRKGEFDIFLT